MFIDGALPGEEARVKVVKRKKQWEKADLVAIRRESSQRVTPRCPHFGLHAGACGGCKMQHLAPQAQVAMKQRVLEDNLKHLGKVKPELVLRPIEGPAWGYRLRARLSVRWVAKKNTVLVGFHERKSSYVADMRECHVIPKRISDMLMPLRALIEAMQARERLPQIELAIGDQVTALVLRNLEPMSDHDMALLRAFGAEHDVQWWLQPKGPDTIFRIDEGGPELAYTLPEFGVRMPFKPTDFTQVNHQINTVLVGRALRLLDVQKDETVIDWFCGLGNFTLPLATMAKTVLGIEGSQTLVDRALDNAKLNGLDAHTRFDARNLFELTADDLVALGTRRQVAGRPPARGRVRAREGAGRAEGGAARGLDGAEAHRLRELQPGHAGARHGPAGAPAPAIAAWRPGRSTCSRTRRTWRAWRCSSGIRTGSRRRSRSRWSRKWPKPASPVDAAEEGGEPG